MQSFQDLFVEARMCIEDAQDSLDTKYYDEDAEDAKAAVLAAVAAFDEMKSGLDKKQQQELMSSNGLKVEQLKGELQMMLDLALEH